MEVTVNITPKVFISYSWVIKNDVLELAEKLLASGVDVIIDIWELKEGQDKYAFMQQSVNDPEVSRVLIVCDKTYAEKANDRAGGVGERTMIISPDVYGTAAEKEKFVTIVMETDDDGIAYLPEYIKSRIYIDLSKEDTYEENFEKLLRNIYGKPEHTKPKLGNRPQWLDEYETVNLTGIRDVIKKLRRRNAAKPDHLVIRARDEFYQALNSIAQNVTGPMRGEILVNQFSLTKPIRDAFINYIDVLISKNMDIGKIIPSFLEHIYNFVPHSNSTDLRSIGHFEVFLLSLWEWFIAMTAILLHYEKYAALHSILTRTYFLRNKANNLVLPQSCIAFNHYSDLLESRYKYMTEFKDKHTLAGELVINRELKPYLTREGLVNADLVIYQITSALSIGRWFPTLYCYHREFQPQKIWSRLESRAHCMEIMPLFGVQTIEALKECVGKYFPDRQMRYHSPFMPSAPNFIDSINLEKIATLN
jgi:hypothetical protein